MEFLAQTDPEVHQAIQREIARQEQQINLIASENLASRAILEAQGSVLTNKYAEGYPGKRYYGGCEHVDTTESLAIERACELFGAEHANVQPHSGTQANMAVYRALLKKGDKLLSMNLDHGGHLSHGHKVNFAGKDYTILSYGVHEETGRIDYDEFEKVARKSRPQMVLAGASAYSREIDFERMAAVARDIEAYFVVDMAHIAGLIAADEHPDPVPHADAVTSTTHKTLRGPRGGLILCRKKYRKKINSAVFPGIQGGPLCHQIAAKAVCFKEAMTDSFKEYQKQIKANARALAQALQERGYKIVSDGTDNHLFLVDLRSKGVTGKVAEQALEAANICLNKNLIPYDPETPWVTSGIRIGTPTVTSRGMGIGEMKRLADLIDLAIEGRDDEGQVASVRGDVAELLSGFPVPEQLVAV